jgi:glycosyltransferase involved in cell wall biosynthesis
VGDVVTIVIPTRDRSALLAKAVASALDQDDAQIEVVVVDDGSMSPVPPGSLPSEVRVIRHRTPRGAAAARNSGLAAARGEWIMFLDDDDTLLPHAVATSLRAAGDSRLPPPVSVVSGIESVGSTVTVRRPISLPKGGAYLDVLLRSGHRYQDANTLLCRRHVIEQIGGWNESLLAAETDDLFLRLTAVSSLQGIPTVTYRMTDNADDRLHRNTRAMIDGTRRTLELHADAFRRCPRMWSLHLVTIGALELEAGDWRASVQSMSRAFALDPFHPRSFRQLAGALAGPKTYRWIRDGRRTRRDPEHSGAKVA